jgi:hypothetical protein
MFLKLKNINNTFALLNLNYQSVNSLLVHGNIDIYVKFYDCKLIFKIKMVINYRLHYFKFYHYCHRFEVHIKCQWLYFVIILT